MDLAVVISLLSCLQAEKTLGSSFPGIRVPHNIPWALGELITIELHYDNHMRTRILYVSSRDLAYVCDVTVGVLPQNGALLLHVVTVLVSHHNAAEADLINLIGKM